MSMVRNFVAIATIFGLVAFAPNSHAFTGLYCLDQEANPSCSNFGPNKQIEEAKLTSLSAGLNTVSIDACRIVEFTLSPDLTTVENWTSKNNCQEPAEPVNVVIGKTSAPSADRVCFYQDDTIEEKTSIPTVGTLNQVAFCYNSPSALQPEPPPLEDLPECDIQGSGGELDQTGIQCNEDPSVERLLISIDPNAPDGNTTLCTCNVNFDPCDPENGGCVSGGPLKAIPSETIFGNDGTWICVGSGASRRCYNR